jgi:hypothetical protein
MAAVAAPPAVEPSPAEKLFLDAIERGDYNTLKTLESVILTQGQNLIRAKRSKDMPTVDKLTNNLRRLLGQYKNLYNNRGKRLPGGGPIVPRDIPIASGLIRGTLDALLGPKERNEEEIKNILQGYLDELLAYINKFKK